VHPTNADEWISLMFLGNVSVPILRLAKQSSLMRSEDLGNSNIKLPIRAAPSGSSARDALPSSLTASGIIRCLIRHQKKQPSPNPVSRNTARNVIDAICAPENAYFWINTTDGGTWSFPI
jgi:hypothetical protein